jgi:hypothetical protein
MKYSHILKLSLALAVVFLLTSARSAAAQGPASELAAMISGTHQFRDENSDVRLDISSIGGVGSTVELLATASGKYMGQDIRQQGVIRLVTEGPDVRATVIPHFAPVTVLSPDVNRFSQIELQAACTVYLERDEGTWIGTTQGPGTCVKAVTGAASQWTVEVRSGAVRFIDAKTKQALVFQKTRDSVSR